MHVLEDRQQNRGGEPHYPAPRDSAVELTPPGPPLGGRRQRQHFGFQRVQPKPCRHPLPSPKQCDRPKGQWLGHQAPRSCGNQERPQGHQSGETFRLNAANPLQQPSR